MNQSLRFIIILVGILFLAMLRFVLIDLSNFAPIAAAGIFGIYLFRNKILSLPFALLALFVSDLIVHATTGHGLYAARIIDYIGLSLGLLLVYFLLTKKQNIPLTLFSAAIGSLVFFVISNFGVWAGGSLYPKTIGGLLTCFEMGVPFYWGTLIGDLYFTALFIGVFEWLDSKILNIEIQSN